MGFGDVVAHALDCMRREKRDYKDFVPTEAQQIGSRLVEMEELWTLWSDVKEKVCKMLLWEIPYEYPHPTVWWYSVVCNINKDAKVYREFVAYIRANKNAFSLNTLYFLYYQLVSVEFRFKTIDSFEGKLELWKLLLDIVEGFSKQVSVSLEEIPAEKRNHNLIIVFSEQVLGERHAPTMIACDRCKTIMTKLGKEVLLINSAEILSRVGNIPFAEAKIGNYEQSMSDENYISWKGVRIPYLQCENNMPNVETLNHILGIIRELAPGRIVAVGGDGILCNLANRIVPALTVGLGPADLNYTGNRYQTLSRKQEAKDEEMLAKLGLPQNHIVESVFTSSLIPQSEKITRADLGVAEDKFLMIVVGNRLDDEVTGEFLSVLEAAMDERMELLFVGKYITLQQKISRCERLKTQSKCIGYVNDLLSRLEVCDLYVNPQRKGGGTSGVAALYMGVPVVTLHYGDVAVNVGDAFCVSNYDEMQRKIKEYCDDKSYYEEMTQKAKARAEILLDTEGEFVRVLKEVDKREKGEESYE